MSRFRFSQQIAVQESDGHVAVSAMLAHHILAAVLVDGAGSVALRQRHARTGRNE
jgi:hypothetical protein